MLKLAIFDYDGLLVESEALAFTAEEKILNRYNKPLTSELFNKYLGYSVMDTLNGYIEYHNLPITPTEFYEERELLINVLVQNEIVLKPGALKLLEYLRKNKVRTVIGSSGTKEYIELGVNKLNIKHFFSNITSVSEVKNGKPNPDLFLRALGKNNTEAAHAIVFEDAVSGITAAKRAGIFCISVPPRTLDIQGHRIADIIVDSLDKVIDIFENKALLSVK